MTRKGESPMKAVMPCVPPDILAWRKQTGADRWDEMWEGVLHMVPAPNREHQDFEWALETWLRTHWAPLCSSSVYHQINVARPGRWSRDFRVPDIVLLSPERSSIDRNEYFDGGPDVVVEIRSPQEETYDKLPFYAEIGVRETWVIDRDSKACEIFATKDGKPEKQTPDADGWWRSTFAGVKMRPSGEGKLEITISGKTDTREIVP